MAILTPNPARLMESLRDTGYTFNTAMADIVDNSIAANATKIKVKIEYDFENQLHVYIADNGCGMNPDGLLNAMRYGSDERSNAASLGKFGMGLKTASTAFCRCLSLISKDNSCDYHKVQWDLDYICKKVEWELQELEPSQDEIDLLEDVAEGGSGTLVVWSKVDRLANRVYTNLGSRDKALNKDIEELRFHFRMVYQRFLDVNYTEAPNVEIWVNDMPLTPWDPFCQSEENTKCLYDKPLKVQIGEEISEYRIKAWLLPRPTKFSSPEAKADARVSNDMEGFYVYRENRLINHGTWLGTYVNDPHFSLLRISFSFSHKLDEAFKIDIKKSRILLDSSLSQYLKDKLLPALRREAEDAYRNVIKDTVCAKAPSAHDDSNKVIEEKAPEVEESKVIKVDSTKGEVQILNAEGGYTAKAGGTGICIIEEPEENEYRVVPQDNLMDGVLWMPTLVDGKHAVSINKSHDYYTKVYYPVLTEGAVVTGMDSLLWALAEAEMSTCNDSNKAYFQKLRITVSNILRSLLEDSAEPTIQ